MALETKYGMIVEEDDICSYLKILKNKVYKLLPLKEEGLDWEKHLNTILIELSGFNCLFSNQVNLIITMSKLESLYSLDDFMIYRKTIFECLNTIEDLR